MEAAEITRNVLMYFILPLWLVAGFADYLCHRAADIEHTSGYQESLLHLLQFGEMAVPILAVMFFEINALIILLMIVSFLLHEATALWDLTYASRTRTITPIEQHVHSFLEMLPLMGLLMIVVLHWTQFTSLFGLAPASFAVRLKEQPLPLAYVVTVLTCVLLFEILPYVEELLRGLHAARQTLTRGPMPGNTKSTVMR
jgi:hypothetical protein